MMPGAPVADIYAGITAIGLAFCAGVGFVLVASFLIWLSEPGP